MAPHDDSSDFILRIIVLLSLALRVNLILSTEEIMILGKQFAGYAWKIF